MWEGWQEERKNKVTIDMRVDRTSLLSIHEQSRQVLQTTISRFGPVPGPQPGAIPRDSATLRKALNFMRPLVEGWCAGTYASKLALRQARDATYSEYFGGGRSGTAVKKRPAARKEDEEGEEENHEESPEQKPVCDGMGPPHAIVKDESDADSEDSSPPPAIERQEGRSASSGAATTAARRTLACAPPAADARAEAAILG